MMVLDINEKEDNTLRLVAVYASIEAGHSGFLEKSGVLS